MGVGPLYFPLLHPHIVQASTKPRCISEAFSLVKAGLARVSKAEGVNVTYALLIICASHCK